VFAPDENGRIRPVAMDSMGTRTTADFERSRHDLGSDTESEHDGRGSLDITRDVRSKSIPSTSWSGVGLAR
jgi:hypothetical protein